MFFRLFGFVFVFLQRTRIQKTKILSAKAHECTTFSADRILIFSYLVCRNPYESICHLNILLFCTFVACFLLCACYCVLLWHASYFSLAFVYFLLCTSYCLLPILCFFCVSLLLPAYPFLLQA